MKPGLHQIILKFREMNGLVFFQDAVAVSSKGLQMNLVKILTAFTLIDFSCNKFNGSMPEEIGEIQITTSPQLVE
ncbi:hypothetical protein RchiOBHm_Chr3g0463331 [Rosa chinensis]|uniref:Non-specific serine/threonine protein kinase n=1 Tax=Rosa chinensis TaxID=74649 RepID=A0A2P6R968_ROSCH|nr:hypothetical protein RchiOBHm_Chr3g0463331 [Rosa chinensis]